MITIPQHQFLWSKADEDACHCRRYSQKEMAEKLKRAGFEVLRMTGFVSLLFPAMWFMRRRNTNIGTSASDARKPKIDELCLPKFLNTVLEAIMAVERLFIKCGINFPFGGSLLVVFRKKE